MDCAFHCPPNKILNTLLLTVTLTTTGIIKAGVDVYLGFLGVEFGCINVNVACEVEPLILHLPLHNFTEQIEGGEIKRISFSALW